MNKRRKDRMDRIAVRLEKEVIQELNEIRMSYDTPQEVSISAIARYFIKKGLEAERGQK